ncbi:unnamed protein product [Rotaria sp. Silwood1]|nr:unnamed protein product [Rotaria sp. Silwood1]CAF3941679.1 unnamed protein product [Rotaria sp. Silwood1]CAF5018196.1 unnamed protein product [Rotaria sp. Silwood1]
MKRGKYSKDFLKAFHEYKNGATSSKVTAKYNIPGSTLRNHKSDPTMKIHGGCSTLLTKHQEQYLVELLKNLEVADVRLIKLLVMKLVSEISICSTCYDLSEVAKNVLQRRQGELKVMKEEKTDASRCNGLNEDVFHGCFEKFDLMFPTNNLIKTRHAIYNSEEVGFSDETSYDETNRTYSELTLANMHRFVPPYESFQYDFLSSEKQMINRIP